MSSITLAEFRFGAEVRRSKRLHQLIDVLIAELRVVPFDGAAADEYGRIAATLRARGRPIGMADSMLAGHARSLDCAMVTRNVAHFARVAGLRVEDWY
jgi:tRNA(fMet)-specific endonuclease VapC